MDSSGRKLQAYETQRLFPMQPTAFNDARLTSGGQSGACPDLLGRPSPLTPVDFMATLPGPYGLVGPPHSWIVPQAYLQTHHQHPVVPSSQQRVTGLIDQAPGGPDAYVDLMRPLYGMPSRNMWGPCFTSQLDTSSSFASNFWLQAQQQLHQQLLSHPTNSSCTSSNNNSSNNSSNNSYQQAERHEVPHRHHLADRRRELQHRRGSKASSSLNRSGQDADVGLVGVVGVVAAAGRSDSSHDRQSRRSSRGSSFKSSNVNNNNNNNNKMERGDDNDDDGGCTDDSSRRSQNKDNKFCQSPMNAGRNEVKNSLSGDDNDDDDDAVSIVGVERNHVNNNNNNHNYNDHRRHHHHILSSGDNQLLSSRSTITPSAITSSSSSLSHPHVIYASPPTTLSPSTSHAAPSPTVSFITTTSAISTTSATSSCSIALKNSTTPDPTASSINSTSNDEQTVFSTITSLQAPPLLPSSSSSTSVVDFKFEPTLFPPPSSSSFTSSSTFRKDQKSSLSSNFRISELIFPSACLTSSAATATDVVKLESRDAADLPPFSHREEELRSSSSWNVSDFPFGSHSPAEVKSSSILLTNDSNPITTRTDQQLVASPETSASFFSDEDAKDTKLSLTAGICYFDVAGGSNHLSAIQELVVSSGFVKVEKNDPGDANDSTGVTSSTTLATTTTTTTTTTSTGSTGTKRTTTTTADKIGSPGTKSSSAPTGSSLSLLLDVKKEEVVVVGLSCPSESQPASSRINSLLLHRDANLTTFNKSQKLCLETPDSISCVSINCQSVQYRVSHEKVGHQGGKVHATTYLPEIGQPHLFGPTVTTTNTSSTISSCPSMTVSMPIVSSMTCSSPYFMSLSSSFSPTLHQASHTVQRKLATSQFQNQPVDGKSAAVAAKKRKMSSSSSSSTISSSSPVLQASKRACVGHAKQAGYQLDCDVKKESFHLVATNSDSLKSLLEGEVDTKLLLSIIPDDRKSEVLRPSSLSAVISASTNQSLDECLLSQVDPKQEPCDQNSHDVSLTSSGLPQCPSIMDPRRSKSILSLEGKQVDCDLFLETATVSEPQFLNNGHPGSSSSSSVDSMTTLHVNSIPGVESLTGSSCPLSDNFLPIRTVSKSLNHCLKSFSTANSPTISSSSIPVGVARALKRSCNRTADGSWSDPAASRSLDSSHRAQHISSSNNNLLDFLAFIFDSHRNPYKEPSCNVTWDAIRAVDHESSSIVDLSSMPSSSLSSSSSSALSSHARDSHGHCRLLQYLLGNHLRQCPSVCDDRLNSSCFRSSAVQQTTCHCQLGVTGSSHAANVSSICSASHVGMSGSSYSEVLAEEFLSPLDLTKARSQEAVVMPLSSSSFFLLTSSSSTTSSPVPIRPNSGVLATVPAATTAVLPSTAAAVTMTTATVVPADEELNNLVNSHFRLCCCDCCCSLKSHFLSTMCSQLFSSPAAPPLSFAGPPNRPKIVAVESRATSPNVPFQNSDYFAKTTRDFGVQTEIPSRVSTSSAIASSVERDEEVVAPVNNDMFDFDGLSMLSLVADSAVQLPTSSSLSSFSSTFPPLPASSQTAAPLVGRLSLLDIPVSYFLNESQQSSSVAANAVIITTCTAPITTETPPSPDLSANYNVPKSNPFFPPLSTASIISSDSYDPYHHHRSRFLSSSLCTDFFPNLGDLSSINEDASDEMVSKELDLRRRIEEVKLMYKQGRREVARLAKLSSLKAKNKKKKNHNRAKSSGLKGAKISPVVTTTATTTSATTPSSSSSSSSTTTSTTTTTTSTAEAAISQPSFCLSMPLLTSSMTSSMSPSRAAKSSLSPPSLSATSLKEFSYNVESSTTPDRLVGNQPVEGRDASPGRNEDNSRVAGEGPLKLSVSGQVKVSNGGVAMTFVKVENMHDAMATELDEDVTSNLTLKSKKKSRRNSSFNTNKENQRNRRSSLSDVKSEGYETSDLEHDWSFRRRSERIFLHQPSPPTTTNNTVSPGSVTNTTATIKEEFLHAPDNLLGSVGASENANISPTSFGPTKRTQQQQDVGDSSTFNKFFSDANNNHNKHNKKLNNNPTKMFKNNNRSHSFHGDNHNGEAENNNNNNNINNYVNNKKTIFKDVSDVRTSGNNPHCITHKKDEETSKGGHCPEGPSSPQSVSVEKEDLRDGLKVLYQRDEYFVEATVKNISPPDVYGVVVEKDRSRRPDILSLEELLSKIVNVVQPSKREQLQPGTRVCVLWSGKSNSFYPGTVLPDEEDEGGRDSCRSDTDGDGDGGKSMKDGEVRRKAFDGEDRSRFSYDDCQVNIDFDDGDSGWFPMDHIRLLPLHFPIQKVEMSLDSVLAASRKKRNNSSNQTPDCASPSKSIRKPAETSEPKEGRSLKKEVIDARCDKRSFKEEAVGSYKDKFNSKSDKVRFSPETESGKRPSLAGIFNEQMTFLKGRLDSNSLSAKTDKSFDRFFSHKNRESGFDKVQEKCNDQVSRLPTLAHLNERTKYGIEDKTPAVDKKIGDCQGTFVAENEEKVHALPSSCYKLKVESFSNIFEKMETGRDLQMTNSSHQGADNNGYSVASFATNQKRLVSILDRSISLTNEVNINENRKNDGGKTEKVFSDSCDTPVDSSLLFERQKVKTKGKRKSVKNESDSSCCVDDCLDDSGSWNGSSRKKRKMMNSNASHHSELSNQDRVNKNLKTCATSSTSTTPTSSTTIATAATTSSVTTGYTNSLTSPAKSRKRSPSPGNGAFDENGEARQWQWVGQGSKRQGIKGKSRKTFYKAIKRGNETVEVGNSVVFLSNGKSKFKFVGCVESFWENHDGSRSVKVKWYYHPEETRGGANQIQVPWRALFQSSHEDENDLQTISHKCQILSFKDFKAIISANNNDNNNNNNGSNNSSNNIPMKSSTSLFMPSTSSSSSLSTSFSVTPFSSTLSTLKHNSQVRSSYIINSSSNSSNHGENSNTGSNSITTSGLPCELYYLAGTYEPTRNYIWFEPGVPLVKDRDRPMNSF